MNEGDVIRLDLPANYAYLNVLSACIVATLERARGDCSVLEQTPAGQVPAPDPARTAYDVSLAAHEICTNIIQYAYAGQTGGRIQLQMVLEHCPRRIVIEVSDTGRAFDPSLVPEPDLDGGQVHGYGLFLVRNLMDEVAYEARPRSNHWRLVKNL
jgi:serine/threonine-protein kinase RsbW